MTTVPTPRRRWLRPALIAVVVIGVLLALPFFLPDADADAIDPIQLADFGGAFVTVNGIDTYYVDSGDRDAPPILFIHGLFGSTRVWRLVIDDLNAAGYRTITYDRPGAGLSDKSLSADYSQPAHADHAAALLDALGIDQALIVGHSAGGNVAAHFALRHPERMTALALVDAAVLAGGPPGFVGGIVAFPPITRWAQVILNAAFTRETLAGSLRGFYADPSLVDEEVICEYWRAFETPGAFNGLIGLTRDAAPNRLTEAQIADISAHTGVIWGIQDTVTPVEQGQRLADLLRDAVWLPIEEAGHQPMEEQPDAFVAALTSLLADRP